MAMIKPRHFIANDSSLFNQEKGMNVCTPRKSSIEGREGQLAQDGHAGNPSRGVSVG